MIHPSKSECYRLLNEFPTPQNVQNHCRAVALTAYTVANALNGVGYDLDLELIISAGLLHDIARTEEKHWEVGADLVERLGYEAESKIIRVHMFYPKYSPIEEINETDMVCIGDRLVLEDKFVGLDRRMEYVEKKMVKQGKSAHIEKVMKKKEETRMFLGEVEKKIGKKIAEIMINADDAILDV